MTYVAAFHCEGGIVLCTDTQETVGDQKRDIEKLYISESYPLAVGGAGIDEAVDAFAQEVIERVERHRPETIPALRDLLKSALAEVLDHDSQMSGWRDEYKKAQYIVAAWPLKDKPAIFRIRGRRAYLVKDHIIIGYETAPNYLLLKRMHRKSLPMIQAVMLAVYLVSQSRELDAFVGGDIRVAVIDSNRAWIDHPEYIKNAELRMAEFAKLIDALVLMCVDPSISPSIFPKVIEAFSKDLTKIRDRWLHQSATITLARTFNDPEYVGEPYPKVFPGAVMTVAVDGSVTVGEEPSEEKQQRLEMMEGAEQMKKEHLETSKKFADLVNGRQALYIGDEAFMLRPQRPAGRST